ncbi:MAG TPA: IS110 family transposase [Firmicutes bacterium]|nr:IS110 family transposase [Bacillota bacterium]
MKYTTFVGLDVHKDSIAVAVAGRDEKDAEGLGVIPNTPQAIAKLVRKLGEPGGLRFCYEAGPCGYGIYRQLIAMGCSCMVVAPSLVPRKPGERVKTDRRDAKKLARLLRSGDLTPVWVPDERQETLRDLLRAREDACQDLLRKRHQLSKFLLRLKLRAPEGIRAWTDKHRRWLEGIRFEQAAQQVVLAEYIHAVDEARSRIERFEQEIAAYVEAFADQRVIKALQALRGVDLITAATLVAELGDITRFENAKQLMSYAGVMPSEYSSGAKERRGSITKSGNAHVRRVIVQSAWNYRHTPKVGVVLKKRQEGLSQEIRAISWKAQMRLNRKYRKMLGRGKTKQVVVVAVARELLGFVWAIAHEVVIESVKREVA